VSLSHPTTLLAELTHRCPLRCPYCSNPVKLTRADEELGTAEWARVLAEARALGVLQLGLSGGEPLVRADVEDIATQAHELGLYTTLVTSGVGLTPKRAARLKEIGLEHIQLSIQDTTTDGADRIAGIGVTRQKASAAALIHDLGFAFSINVVLHRANIDHIGELIDLAAALGADRIELANTQYYGWALQNRAALLPSASQVQAASAVADAAITRYRGTMQVLYVLPDYHESYPKPCYGGWGRHYLVITPDGRVLPCHGATHITTMRFENVRDWPLASIWNTSDAFQAFRGEAWMKPVCAECPRKAVDFGGCRCQAFALTGDAANPDPVCTKTPLRRLIDEAVEAQGAPAEYRYRTLSLETV